MGEGDDRAALGRGSKSVCVVCCATGRANRAAAALPGGTIAMQILVGWDNAVERETITSFLNIGDNTADVFGDASEFETALRVGSYEVVLLALNFPTQQECLTGVKKWLP